MNNVNLKKLVLPNLPYLLFVYLFDKAAQAVRLAPGTDLSAKLLGIGDGFTAAFHSLVPSFHGTDILVGIAGAVLVRLIVYAKGKNAKKYRKGVEYGSARWGNCMRENTTKIRNIKQYLKAALFNAPSTIGNYYTSLVSHDMASDAWNKPKSGFPDYSCKPGESL